MQTKRWYNIIVNIIIKHQADVPKRKQEVINMQKETRKLKVTFDRERLHSAIVLAMRRRRIPKELIGYDIIRGTVFGMIDHPEYSFKDAIAKAVDVCRLPGSPETVEDGIEEAFECVDVVLREKDFYDPETNEKYTNEQIVEKVVQSMVYDIYKDFCYTQTMAYINKLKLKDDFRTEIIKNMLFKKLVADDSTQVCTYEYAFRKSFVWPASEPITDSEIKQKVDAVLGEIPAGFTPYEYVLKMADEIYAENAAE